jgi:MscS family membrane protein
MNFTIAAFADYLPKVLLVLLVLVVAVLANRVLRFRKVPFLRPFRSFLIWSFALLLILSNLGFDVTSLIAGLGIGGLAVALGLQSTLENIFSSITLLAEKTFAVGDTIRLTGSEEGKVLKMGFRSSILETADKKILIIPNKLLVNGIIEKKQ